MYRICWSITNIECAGNGNYVESKELATAWLKYLTSEYPDMFHWIEEKR